MRPQSDLSDYVPLGSLLYATGQRSRPDEARMLEVNTVADDWKYGPSLNLLLKRHRIRLFRIQPSGDLAWLRIYSLAEDVGRAHFDQAGQVSHHASRALRTIIANLDPSPEAWNANSRPNTEHPQPRYHFGSRDDESLFYIFNTLPSPDPENVQLSCQHSDQAMQTVLEEHGLTGLSTSLYDYQKHTIAAMIAREVDPKRGLDPRLQSLRGPTGTPFYYNYETGQVFRDRIEYYEPRGGILGESMGLGKTLICLGLVLATKGHWPQIPPEYSIDHRPTRSQVGSLREMAASATVRARVPWRPLFQNLAYAGEHYSRCVELLEKERVSYTVPPPQTRHSPRESVKKPTGKVYLLSETTIAIVPQNLLSQWKNEIQTHLYRDALKILYLDTTTKTETPNAHGLVGYDLILISRSRFEQEFRSDSFEDNFYHSPLKDVHFLRVIMDEGHSFASYGRKNDLQAAFDVLQAERRWLVTGTPSSSLVGVDISTAAMESSDTKESPAAKSNASVLEARRAESAREQEAKDLEKLGGLIAGFLKVQPWANSRHEDPASWNRYTTSKKLGSKRPLSLRALLQSLVVRHHFADIEADLQLPPLHNTVVHLEPSYHDKLRINLFILTLVANAVTSERVDDDYMFNPKNRRHLSQLVANLRQSSFYWTSFPPEIVATTLKVSRKYLESETAKCSAEDREILQSAIQIGQTVMDSPSWTAFARAQEMGVFVEDFPSNSVEQWSLVDRQGNEPLLTGLTQLSKAQEWLDSHLYMTNPTVELADVGKKSLQNIWRHPPTESTTTLADATSPEQSKKSNQKESSGERRLTPKQTVSRAKASLDTPRVDKYNTGKAQNTSAHNGTSKTAKPALKSALKSSISSTVTAPTLPSDSPLAATKVIGTASSKLSYLLDKVTQLHTEEKILIFFDGDHIAYYIAQALDIISIRYLIYNTSLTLARQSAYITTFNTTETFRVLLMDVRRAAHGLHIASASRVFFVNPVWQPHIEAQAIKRAHRIGQKRPVYAETLVLKDTLEDQMLRRRKDMTAQEHQEAEKNLLDDARMNDMIKDARFLPILPEEINSVDRQIAKLLHPHQVFGRSDRPTGNANDPSADLVFPNSTPMLAGRKRPLDFLDESSHGLTKGDVPSPEALSKKQSALSNGPLESTGVQPSPSGNTIPDRALRWKSGTGDSPAENSLTPRGLRESPPRRRVGFADAVIMPAGGGATDEDGEEHGGSTERQPSPSASNAATGPNGSLFGGEAPSRRP